VRASERRRRHASGAYLLQTIRPTDPLIHWSGGRMSLNRRALFGFLLASLPAIAHADDEKATCLAQHESGQMSRRVGHFDAAREQFAACTSDACPPPVRRRCVEFLAELDAAQPTIVVAVHDSDGHDIVHGLSMTLDGGAPWGVPATALRLDPGEHVLQIVSSDRRGASPPVERRFVVREGEKDRRIDVLLTPGASLPQPPVAHASAPISMTARVFIGVSAASLFVAGTTSGAGWGIRAYLASSCSPHCTQSQVEPLRVLWPTSFVALGIGVASGAVALALVLTNRHPGPDRVGIFASPDGVGWRFGR
jgi:hypothetical protein